MRSFMHCGSGPRHDRLGVPCQDEARVATLCDGEVDVLVACDGMGGMPCGAEASKAACRAAFTALTRCLPKDGRVRRNGGASPVEAAFMAAYARLEQEARALNRPLSDFGTTLAACVFDRTARWLAWGAVGDSGLLIARPDGLVQMASTPQKGPDCRCQTFGVVDEERWTFGLEENVGAVALCTDGVLERMYGWCADGTAMPTDAACALFDLAATADDEAGGSALSASLEGACGPLAGIGDDRTLLLSACEPLWDPAFVPAAEEVRRAGAETSEAPQLRETTGVRDAPDMTSAAQPGVYEVPLEHVA